MLILSLFYPHFFHNYDIDVKPTYSTQFLKKNSQLFHANDRQSKPLVAQHIPLFSLKFSTLLTKNIVVSPSSSLSYQKKNPTISLKFFVLSNLKYPTFFSLLTKSIPLFHSSFPHYFTKSIVLFSLKFSKLLTKSIPLFSNVFHVI